MLQEFTGEQIYEACVKNGLEQIRKNFIQVDDNGKIVAGCLLTQGAVNLKALPATKSELGSSDSETEVDNTPEDEYVLTTALNAYLLPEDSRWQPDEKSAMRIGLANAIMFAYDKVDVDDNYVLRTYNQALEMLKEILTPVWETKFTLETRDSWTFFL